MTTTDAETKTLLDATISGIQTTEDLCKDISNFENLPLAFNATARCVPSIQTALVSCRDSLVSTSLEMSYFQELSTALETCKVEIARLNEIFHKAVKYSNPNAQHGPVAKEHGLEALMKAILNHVIQTLRTPPFQAVSGTQIKDLEQALAVFEKMESPSAAKASTNVNNYGNGVMNTNFGSGPQNNFENKSSGSFITGSIGTLRIGK
ncbi:hypothetical protein PENSTE_c006G06543 [Penicillium steckii]|uniref:NACHT-NTPase and P-loop NTPases N-terminal domain-containing protein n=1 Tax=Penicillium steckii TaxID=303698 RepID=A0A1V6TFL9_9EURO|nr:hypothetical protein PENSTE_c006G06543 [Penicillium steckii]